MTKAGFFQFKDVKSGIVFASLVTFLIPQINSHPKSQFYSLNVSYSYRRGTSMWSRHFQSGRVASVARRVTVGVMCGEGSGGLARICSTRDFVTEVEARKRLVNGIAHCKD